MPSRPQFRRLFTQAGLTYLLRDEFTTNASAPLTSPRICEPGQGQLTITDTGNKLTIASGKLTENGSPGSSFTDPRIVSTSSFARAIGRTFLINFNINGQFIIGWNSANNAAVATYDHACNILSTSIFAYSRSAGTQVQIGTLTSATDYTLAIVLDSTGAYIFIKGGTEYASWTLLFSFAVFTTTPLYMSMGYNGAGTARLADYIRITDLPGAFSTNLGIATLNVASPSGQYTGTADAVIHLTETSPVALGVESGFKYRYTDANNYWRVYFDATGQIKLDSVSAGTPTNRITVAGAISTSQTRTLCVVCRGSVHDIYTLNGNNWTKQGSQITLSHQDTSTDVVIDTGALWTAANLRSFPRRSSIYDALN